MCIHRPDMAPSDQVKLVGLFLDQTARLCLDMDTEDETGTVGSSRVEYPYSTILDAVLVLNSVLSNRAIHDGHISTEQEAKAAGQALHRFILDHYGFDTYNAEQILEKQ